MKKNTRIDLVNEYDAFVEENSMSETPLIWVDLSSSEDESNDNSETQRQTSPATYDPSPAPDSYNGFSTDQDRRCSMDHPRCSVDNPILSPENHTRTTDLHNLIYWLTPNMLDTFQHHIYQQHIYGQFIGTNDTTDVSRNNT